MEQIKVNATKRILVGKQVKGMRREGYLPAVIYGKGIDSIPVKLDFLEAVRYLSGISPSRLVVVSVDGEEFNTLVRDKQRDPVSGTILHIDFQSVSMTETLRTQVAIDLVGESPAVVEEGGIIVTGLEELHIECLPTNLPERISVDISVLKEIGDGLYVRDMAAMEGVEVLNDPEEMIVLITPPEALPEEEEEEEELLMAAEMEEPEVIERGRREEEFEEEE